VPGFIHIKSSGMDLDNIDNVYRMGHYLGFQSASIEHVFPLVDSLRVPPDSRVFAISADTACKAEDWHILRESVYREFIYSPEYLSFECQIFHLVDSLAAILKDPKEIASLANVPDDVLLWQYFNDDSFQSIRPLLRRLIALQSYNCLYFGRVDAPDICNALPSATHLAHFKSAFIQTILNAYSDSPNSVISDGPVARWINLLRNHHALPIGPIHIHITTDKRKTNRHLELLTYDRDNSQASMSIGYDSYFVVGALFSEVDLQPADHAFLAQAFARTLSEWSGSQVDTSYRPPVSGMHQLSLGI